MKRALFGLMAIAALATGPAHAGKQVDLHKTDGNEIALISDAAGSGKLTGLSSALPAWAQSGSGFAQLAQLDGEENSDSGGDRGGGNNNYRYTVSDDFSSFTYEDQNKAKSYKASCDNGNMVDCHNMALLYKKNGSQHALKVVDYYTKACQNSYGASCYQMGSLYEVGTLVTASKDSAIYRYKRGCDSAKDRSSCNATGRLNKSLGNTVDARIYYQKGCDLGFQTSCTALNNLDKSNGGGGGSNSDFTYDENQKLQTNKSSCDGGSARACFDVAELYLKKGTKYPNEVTNYYRLGCEGRYNSACYRLGYAYEKGQYGISPSSSQAIYWQRYGCDTVGYDISCASAGRLYKAQGNTSSAIAYYRKGCNKGYSLACTQLSNLEGNGGNGGGDNPDFTYDENQSLRSDKSSCNNGVSRACFDVAELYKKKGTKYPNEVITYYTKACEGSYKSGCYRLGYAYEKGQAGISSSMSKAVYWQRYGCDTVGYDISCASAGRLYKVQGNTSSAISYYRKGCNKGYNLACTELSKLEGNGGGSTSSLQKYLNGCSAGTARDCNSAAAEYKKQSKMGLAADYYGRACNGNYYLACYWVGYQYEKGDGVNQSSSQSIYWQKKGCAGDNRTSCSALGRLYRKQGDDSNSRYYYQKSCNLGFQSACNQLNR